MSAVLIIRASRGIGIETVKLALKAGHSVRAMARSASAIRLRDPKLQKLDGDALDQHTIERALAGANAVIQTLGVSPTPEMIFGGTRLFSVAVSNFNTSQMEALFRDPNGDRCATNQVPYSLNNRSIEGDLLPWCQQHDLPVMAYSPLGGPDSGLLRDATLARIGAAHSCSASAIALAWTIRNGKVIAIPESGSVAHVRENAVALSLTLTPEELQTLDTAHPAPGR
jgi:predicted oxidoreductase